MTSVAPLLLVLLWVQTIGQLSLTTAQSDNVTTSTEITITSSTPATVETTSLNQPVHQQAENVNTTSPSPTAAVLNISSALEVKVNISSETVNATNAQSDDAQKQNARSTDDVVTSANDTTSQHIPVDSDDSKSNNVTMPTTTTAVAANMYSLNSTQADSNVAINDSVADDARSSYKQLKAYQGVEVTTTTPTLNHTSPDQGDSTVTEMYAGSSNGTRRNAAAAGNGDAAAVNSSLPQSIQQEMYNSVTTTATSWNTPRNESTAHSRQQPATASSTLMTYYHHTNDGNTTITTNVSSTHVVQESRAENTMTSLLVNTSNAHLTLESSSTNAVVLQQSASNTASVHISFNCLRPRTSCSGSDSKCLPDTGRCHCSPDRQGYDCNLLTSSIVPATDCKRICTNGGTCHVDNEGKHMCYCPEAYYGENCQHQRVRHGCSPDSTQFSIAPIVGQKDRFAGSVYVLGHEEDPNCVFAPRDSSHSQFVKTIPFTQCGGALNQTDYVSGLTSLSWQIVVRYDDVLLETDQQLTFTCYARQSTDGRTYDWHAWMVASENMIDSQLPTRTVATDVQPVLMSLETVDGKPITGPQQLGASVRLRYLLNGGNVYNSFRVEKVSVSNAMSGDKRHVIDLVSANCITDDALRVKRLVQSMESGSNMTEMSLNFKVFKLRYTNQLVFENVIKACRTTTDCRPMACQSMMKQSSRKKRDVNAMLFRDSGNPNYNSDVANKTNKVATTDDSLEQQQLRQQQPVTFNRANATLTVWYPGDNTNECLHVKQQQQTSEDVRLQNVNHTSSVVLIICAVIVAAVSLVVGAVIVLICCIKLMLSVRKQQNCCSD